MPKQQSHAHHYVPQWYQKRFLSPGQTNYFYLDLDPPVVKWHGGSHTHKAMFCLGPGACFYKDNLYAMRFFGRMTDMMERRFFGAIDGLGCSAVEHFAGYSGISRGTGEMFQALAAYMGAQRFRTPRGLAETQKRLSYMGRGDENDVLLAIHTVFQSYSAMWSEGVWEIARATQSPTKFIVTDDPVTFYCRAMFRSEWTFPEDTSLKSIGTRTLFPLGPDSCLIITHLQLARDPWNTPTEYRANARLNDPQAIKHLGEIQFGRELDEDEVLRINYILKKRATRYIAAAKEEWLYPERRVSTTEWSKLDDDWFLLPHLWKIPFTAEIMWGNMDGRAWAVDEYGRDPRDPMFKNKRQREKEWVTFEEAKREWARRRVSKSRAEDHRLGREVANKMMDDFLREEGLLPSSTL